MEILKRNADYALRALAGLAEMRNTPFVSARGLAHRQKLAEPILRKLLQRLARAGFVRSTKGPRGGFRLARRPEDISVLEVAEAIQGPLALNRCFLGVRTCPNRPSCRVSAGLARFQRRLKTLFRSISLDQLTGADHD